MDPTGNSWRRLSSVRLSRQILEPEYRGPGFIERNHREQFRGGIDCSVATLGRFNWQEARRRLTLVPQ